MSSLAARIAARSTLHPTPQPRASLRHVAHQEPVAAALRQFVRSIKAGPSDYVPASAKEWWLP